METANFKKWGEIKPPLVFRLYPILVKDMTEEEVVQKFQKYEEPLRNYKQLGDNDAY